MKRYIAVLMACVVTVALAASPLLAQQARQKKPTAGAPDQSNKVDEAAIKNIGKSFLKAYMAGDAKGLAAHWTENGEYTADDGTTIRGRAKIESAYAELFAKKKDKTHADIEVTTIRFPSRDTAIEEGYFRVRTGKETPVSSKYSILHVREGGTWLMALVREWPGEGASLRDLDWLIGTWVAKRDDTEVRTTYEWWGDKSFIKGNISLKLKDRTVTGFQMIARDASTGQLRSWIFDADGSFGEATWTRDGKKWMEDSAAVLQNGSVLAATNILTRLDDDTFTFQSVQRTVDGEETSDIPPIRVTRVKGK
jgi:uncharacterized protein (TIGR02246 family)